MKIKDFERLLKEVGFKPDRQSGSHLVWISGERHVSVPQGRDLNKMLARRLLKEIGYIGVVPQIRYEGK